jgi:hypothetical protein
MRDGCSLYFLNTAKNDRFCLDLEAQEFKWLEEGHSNIPLTDLFENYKKPTPNECALFQTKYGADYSEIAFLFM